MTPLDPPPRDTQDSRLFHLPPSRNTSISIASRHIIIALAVIFPILTSCGGGGGGGGGGGNEVGVMPPAISLSETGVTVEEGLEKELDTTLDGDGASIGDGAIPAAVIQIRLNRAVTTTLNLLIAHTGSGIEFADYEIDGNLLSSLTYPVVFNDEMTKNITITAPYATTDATTDRDETEANEQFTISLPAVLPPELNNFMVGNNSTTVTVADRTPLGVSLTAKIIDQDPPYMREATYHLLEGNDLSSDVLSVRIEIDNSQTAPVTFQIPRGNFVFSSGMTPVTIPTNGGVSEPGDFAAGFNSLKIFAGAGDSGFDDHHIQNVDDSADDNNQYLVIRMPANLIDGTGYPGYIGGAITEVCINLLDDDLPDANNTHTACASRSP